MSLESGAWVLALVYLMFLCSRRCPAVATRAYVLRERTPYTFYKVTWCKSTEELVWWGVGLEQKASAQLSALRILMLGSGFEP